MVQTDITVNALLSCEELLGKSWLFSDSLQYYLEIINDNQLKDTQTYIINPTTSHAIKECENFESYLDSYEIKNKNILIIPVSDATSLTASDGIHWSLLVFSRSENQFYYYDFMLTHNLPHACKIKNKISKYLNLEGALPIKTVKVPPQINGYDYGVYGTLWPSI